MCLLNEKEKNKKTSMTQEADDAELKEQNKRLKGEFVKTTEEDIK